MKRLKSTAVLVLTLWALVLSGVEAQDMRIPEAGSSLLNPRVQAFLKGYGPQYGLKATDEGKLFYSKPDVKTGKPLEQALSPMMVQRLLGLMSDATPEETELRMAMALESYLQPRQEVLAAGTMAKLFTLGADGRKHLTQMGRNLLMDILTAEDGLTFAPPTGMTKPKKQKTISTSKALLAMQRAGILVVNALSNGSLEGAVSAGGAFDGTIEQGVRGLDGYDWNKEGDPVLIRKNREASGLYAYSVGGKEGRPDSEYLRVLIAAKNPVNVDRLKMTAQDADASVYAESGLDPALMARHGAKVVRAVDNLIAVDVPIAEAPKLGVALAEDGILSRPARMFKMVADQIKRGPSWPDPLFSVLPFATSLSPSVPLPKSEEGGRFTTLNADSRSILKVSGLAAKGMDGTGSVVGIIDSGLDMSHPDFENRVAAYIDLTDGGTKDYVGHGTHVAGSIGGSGKASDGKFKGMAPGTKYVVLKVFGAEGSTSEDTILAALKAAKSLPADIRPQVINMSLGGPGDPETDPLSVMSNEMMVKDNIVMAIAAGNSGPGKKTIGSPGNARFVMTVTGTNKESKFPFFPSRGPVTTSKGKTYNKPDISTISGDVSTTQRLRHFIGQFVPSAVKPEEEPADPGCFYAPGGVISTRSKDDADTQCVVKGNTNYRYMTGTSMATPLAAGIAADVVGYMKSKNHAYKASEVKALMMETATDLKEKPEVQGAGMVDGDKLAKVLESRVKMGLPVGNVAFAIAHRTSRWDEFNMKKGDRFEHTPMGLLDKKSGHLIHNDAEFDSFTDEMETAYKAMPIYSRIYRKIQYWWNG